MSQQEWFCVHVLQEQSKPMQPVGSLILTNLDNKWKRSHDYLFLTGHIVRSTRPFSISLGFATSRLYRSQNVRWPQPKGVKTKLIGSPSAIVAIRAAAVCSSCRPSSFFFVWWQSQPAMSISRQVTSFILLSLSEWLDRLSLLVKFSLRLSVLKKFYSELWCL